MKQQEFLEIDGELSTKPLRTDDGDMLGWALYKNGVALERNRGGVRIFKSKDSIDAFCIDNGIDSYTTKNLLKGL